MKAFNIAIDVFGRPDTFDPQSNSIVRVEIGRLRRGLELFFAVDGKYERISIVIPKGSYRPQFVSEADPSKRAEEAESLDNLQGSFPTSWRMKPFSMRAAVLAIGALLTIALIWGNMTWSPRSHGSPSIALNSIEILEIENRSGVSNVDTLALALTAEIQKKIGNIKTLIVLSSNAQNQSKTPMAQHVLSGYIVKLDYQYEVYLTLADSWTKAVIWTEHYPLATNSDISGLQSIISKAVFDLRGQIFTSVRRLIEQNKVRSASPIELFLLATWFPGFAESSLSWEYERVALARRALSSDPKYGPAHSVLAEKLAYLANIDPQSDSESLRGEARGHARDALQYATDDPDAVFNIALHYWHQGILDKSTLAIKRVLELQSGHPLANFMSQAIAYTCAPAPSEVITRLLSFDQSLETGNPIRWVTLGWLARLHFNRAEYSKALEYGLQANHIFTSPDTVFLVAASYIHLANSGEARRLLADQTKFWPGMKPRHYIEGAIARRCSASVHKEMVIASYQVLVETFPD